MYKYFKLYWFCVFLRFIAGFLLLINYFFKFNFVFLFKIPLIIGTLALFFLHFKQKLYLNFVSLLFFVYLFISITVAIYYKNELSMKTISHLYTIFIAIFGMSFGYHFAKNYTIDIAYKVKKYLKYYFLASFLILLLYLYGHFFTALIPYYGFDTELPLNFSFFLAQGQIGLAIISFLLILLSGKRSPLITVVILFLLFLFKGINFKKIKNIIISIFLPVLLISVFYIMFNRGLLSRFEIVASINIEDETSVYNATSGRSSELIGLFNHMNYDKLRWYVGSGLGGSYYVDIIRGDDVEKFAHYTHLSYLSLIFLFGVPFVILFLSYIFFLFIKNYKYINNKYYLALLSSFIGSIFGAGILVDSIFWVLLGINIFIHKANPNSVILING